MVMSRGWIFYGGAGRGWLIFTTKFFMTYPFILEKGFFYFRDIRDSQGHSEQRGIRGTTPHVFNDLL